MVKLTFWGIGLVFVVLSCAAEVNGDGTCDVVLEDKENGYLAKATLADLIKSFVHSFDTVHRSEILKANLSLYAQSVMKLLITSRYFEKIEIMIKAIDEDILNETIEVLCRETSPNEIWLKCIITGILKMAIHFRNIIKPALDIEEENSGYSPWPSPRASGKRSYTYGDAFTPRLGRAFNYY